MTNINQVKEKQTMYREQLQFNLHSPPKRFNLETNFVKPRPIVIEKLAPKQQEVRFQKAPARLSSNDTPFSSLSSERLEFAMQLAKRDVKKLKTMLANPTVEMPQVLKQEHVRPMPLQDQGLYLADDFTKKPKSSPGNFSFSLDHLWECLCSTVEGYHQYHQGACSGIGLACSCFKT